MRSPRTNRHQQPWAVRDGYGATTCKGEEEAGGGGEQTVSENTSVTRLC